MSFNASYNKDDVLLRNIIVGLLDVLNRTITYEQAIAADEVQELSVPFFYNMAGDEAFMQSFYLLNGVDCEGPKYAEGNYDPVPRGILTLTSMNINSSALTNKFVRGNFNKEVDGTIKAYSAYLNPIPLTLNFDVEIICDTLLESMKIVQQTIDAFYKVAIYSVDFRGQRVPCQVGFSEQFTIEKPLTFTYGDDTKITIKFPLEMESYQPVFDKPTTRFRGNIMDHGIGNNIYAVSGVSGEPDQYIAKLDVEVDPSLE